ncbi:N-6 DNA methylase [Snodgrassella sp. B3800]|uniref:type I restriction-modification system subunit M n=1 Tax=Snodgrassella sp. B3800 TaxID=2818039 RepID=UPI00226A4C0B|nr:type I restriction-modification system subunit M [Snodgrassella sp. B3800]MCX8745857.1 N-6 DNA methylase [Snodgrassella sp. B3800]
MHFEELKQLEYDLWEAADQLRANSKLTASEYSMPVLGLIFLRHATNRFNELLSVVEKDVPKRATGNLREERIKLGFQGKAAIYLPKTARYDFLAELPADKHLGKNIRDAMIAIEDSVTDQSGQKLLEGALPKDYLGFEQDLLAELIKIFNRPALQEAKGDVFGRIYEYFLNKFAQSGAQEGGEFFTPPSLVRMIVNVIEPDHGIVLDPACGSGGMFVQTGHFIEQVYHKETNEIDITFYGQEKADLNSKLARMNLAVHGLEGKILIGNTFYEDLHQLAGKCDFVMANPPFNVDGVQVSKIKNQVGENQTGRLPFGLPGIAGKSKANNKSENETISNANSLWIEYFYSYLNDNGRAGFVMASSASDAGNKDKEIRQKLVETGHVDVMISIGPKFFYTRTLPCTLWFYDKGKPQALLDTVLMIDARNTYTTVSAKSHIFTDEQLANLTAITWLYRGEQNKYISLLSRYQNKVKQYLADLPEKIEADTQQINQLQQILVSFKQIISDKGNIAAIRKKLGKDHQITDELLKNYQQTLSELKEQSIEQQQILSVLLTSIKFIAKKIEAISDKANFSQRKTLQTKIETLILPLKEGLTTLETRHKGWLKLLELAEKPLKARQWPNFVAENLRDLKKALSPRDKQKREKPTVRDQSIETLKQAQYFIKQGCWLLSRFPEGEYCDVAGLCKSVTRVEIAEQDYSLTPGRYVGVALNSDENDSEEGFINRIKEIHNELDELNSKAMELSLLIKQNILEYLE